MTEQTDLNARTSPDRQSPISPGRRSSSTSEVPVSIERTSDNISESQKSANDTHKVQKSASFDSADNDNNKKPFSAFKGSFKRKSIRRRSSKRLERPEPKYGQNTTEYEVIRERVLQERAVVNAIEALQERWRMLMFMYDDCVEHNEGRKERRLQKLSIQRQYELIVIISIFLLMCLPAAIFIAIFICRVR